MEKGPVLKWREAVVGKFSFSTARFDGQGYGLLKDRMTGSQPAE
jgi:hypothetical protein